MSAPTTPADPYTVAPGLPAALPLDDPTRHRLVEHAYRRHLPALGPYAEQLAARLGADLHLAHDAVHDVFGTLLAGRRDDVFARDETGLTKHLYSAVKHRLAALCREERRRARREGESVYDVQTVDDPVTTALEADAEAAALRRLAAQRTLLHAVLAEAPPRAVEAFHLIGAGALSYEAVAERMGISPTTVRVLVSGIKRRLHALQQRDPSLASEPGAIP